MERLNHCVLDVVQNNSWNPIKFSRSGTSVSHLIFAEASNDQAIMIKCIPFACIMGNI